MSLIETQPHEESGQGHAVLVVDDDPAVVRLLKMTLRQSGFDVATAYNGAEALDSVMRHEPEAIVLDIEMPVMDGRTFFHELRGRHYDVPVLILSADNARGVQRELGAQASVGKPFFADDLIDAVISII
ncbi:MAG: response regulator [Dehalococcoidia bacterium]|nr:response regulator [Dehalococcoidia bacterium]